MEKVGRWENKKQGNQNNIIKVQSNRLIIKMLSQLDRQFLKRQLKILPSDPSKWHKQQYTRLLALLKFPELVEKQFLDRALDHQDIKNLHTIIERIEPHVTELTYFPLHKLKSCLGLIINFSEDDSTQSSLLHKYNNEKAEEINIKESAVLKLVESLGRLQDMYIIQLTCDQVTNLAKQCGLHQHAVAIKKYNIDGFNLLCSLSDWDTLKEIKNYFPADDIKLFLETSYLFMTQYYRQILVDQMRKSPSQTELSKKTTETDEQSVKQCIISSTELSKKYSEDDIQIELGHDENDSVAGFSEMGTSEIAQSQISHSDLGKSEIANSEMGTSEIRQSVYAQSQRGSIYADSVRGSVDCRMSFRVANNDGRASMMYNSEILNELKEVSLSLPFDLLNLEPLQQIKIRSLKTPYGKDFDKDFWIFSVKGAKLGRDKENDLRFPDELSISGKHAQVLFKSQMFHLQDLGSKTGTYLKIQNTIPLQDGTCIQFSTDVEILFRVIEKNQNEGVIKTEIKKPENLPDYKISLKEKYKIKIGRSDKCHIRINNNQLAEKHSQIFYKDGEFYFKNCHPAYMSWLRLSPKSVRSQIFKLNIGDVFRLSSKKSFFIEEITRSWDKIAN